MRPVEFTSEELCSDPRLRIALVTETYPPEVNGVAMTLKRMVDGLIARGHRVQLIRPRQDLHEREVRRPEFEELLARGWKLPRYEGLRFGLPAKAALVRAWSRQGPDLVHVATEGPLGWTAVSAAAKLKLPVTSDFHTNFDHYSGHYGVGWLKQPVSAYLRRFHNRTALTFVPTDDMAETLRSQGYRHVDVIARGVDTDLFSPAKRDVSLRRSWGVEGGGVAVLCVGRLAAEKNLGLAMRAFRAIKATRPDAKFVLVGDGPLRAAIAREFPDAILAGMRIGDDLAKHYASADVFLFPSLTETFGNVTLEAMASGLCVVAYRYAAAAQVVVDEQNGLTVECGDEHAFIEQAVRAATGTELLKRIAGPARRQAESLSWDKVNDQFEAALLRTWRSESHELLTDGVRLHPGSTS